MFFFVLYVFVVSAPFYGLHLHLFLYLSSFFLHAMCVIVHAAVHIPPAIGKYSSVYINHHNM